MAKLPAKKRLIFHLRGGPLGPHAVQADPAEETYGEAQALWNMSRGGSVGCEFNCMEQGKIGHYRVIDKREMPDAITVTCEFLGNG